MEKTITTQQKAKKSEIIENGNTYYVTSFNGNILYYKDEQCQIKHRIDGPSIEYRNGDKEWHIDGKRHRVGGPAVEWKNCNLYFLNGIEYTEKEYWNIIKFGNFV